ALPLLVSMLVACSGSSPTPTSPGNAPPGAPANPGAPPGGGATMSAPAATGPAPHTSPAHPAIGAASAPIWVTDEAGLFTKYGLDVDVQYLQGNASYAALIAGQIDFLFGNPHNLVSMAAEGTEVKVLACFKPIVSDYTIMATPEIRQAT